MLIKPEDRYPKRSHEWVLTHNWTFEVLKSSDPLFVESGEKLNLVLSEVDEVEYQEKTCLLLTGLATEDLDFFSYFTSAQKDKEWYADVSTKILNSDRTKTILTSTYPGCKVVKVRLNKLDSGPNFMKFKVWLEYDEKDKLMVRPPKDEISV